MTATPWLTVDARRRAADRQHSRTPAPTSRRASSRASSRRGSRARTPTGGSTSSTISPPTSARRSCAPRSRARSSTSTAIPPAPRSIPARRRRSLCPTDDLRRRAALSRRARRPTRPRSPSGARRYFEPYHAALAAEIARLRADARPRRALRRPFDPLAHPAPVRRRAAAVQSRHQRRREPASPALRERSARDLRRERRSPCRRRPLQGRLDHAPLRPARRAASQAMQMELACRAYMDEPERVGPRQLADAARSRARRSRRARTLKLVLQTLLAFVARRP